MLPYLGHRYRIAVHPPTPKLSLANPHLICPLTNPAKRPRRKLNPRGPLQPQLYRSDDTLPSHKPNIGFSNQRLLSPRRPHSANTKPWATTPAPSWTPLSKGPTVSPSPAWGLFGCACLGAFGALHYD